MAAEENEHRRLLIDKFIEKFGNHIPLVRRNHIRGYIQRRPLWQVRPLGIEAVRPQAVEIEEAAGRFYQQAASRTNDADIRQLLRRPSAPAGPHLRPAPE